MKKIVFSLIALAASSAAFAQATASGVNGLVTTTWHMEDWFGLFLQLGQFPPSA